MERRKLRAVKPGDGYVTRRKPVTVVGNGILPDDAYENAIRLLASPTEHKAVTGIEDELHDIRVELKSHGEFLERIAVALEKIANGYVG